MIYRKILTVSAILIVIAALSLTGCNAKGPNNITTIVLDGAANPVVAYGKVVDRQTRLGIAGATVSVKFNGSWYSVSTAADSSTAPDSTAGDFYFAGLPIGVTIPIVIRGPQGGTISYVTSVNALYTGNHGGNDQGINHQISTDWGQLPLEHGVLLTVHVVSADTGAYLTKSDGSALPVYINLLNNAAYSIYDTLATRDTTDTNKYTVTIPQTGDATVYVPALDTTGDGKYDYQANTATVTNSGGLVTGVGTLTTVIALSPITNGEALVQVASNAKTYGADSGGTALTMIGKNEPINFFFNMPVTVAATGADSVTLTYTDNFKSMPSVTFSVVAEQAVTVTQGADNCLVTITPSAALIDGKTYTLKGGVRTIPASGADDAVVPGPWSTTTFMAKPTATATTLTAAGAITLDNFNNYTAGVLMSDGTTTTGQAAGTVSIVFPVPVWGTVRKISTTVGTTTTVNNGTPVAITGQGMAWYESPRSAAQVTATAYNATLGNTGGTRSGALFVSTDAGYTLGSVVDSTTATPQSLRLGLDIYDADGNTYRAEADFSVL